MTTATYYIRDDFLAQEVVHPDHGKGVLVVWDQDALHGFGEFIAWQDFMEGEFETVDYAATDFTDLSPYNMRQMTQEVFGALDELREKLRAEYVSKIGYDPFADDPNANTRNVARTLREWDEEARKEKESG